MSKKDELKLVFDFIADFLREDIDNSEAKQISIEEPIEEVKPKTKMESFIESINPPNVKDIMERVEKFDNSPTFPSNPILGDRERDLEETLSRVTNQVDILVKEREHREKTRMDDLQAKQDFWIIKENRNNLTPEDRESLNQNNFAHSLIDRLKNSNTSYSGMTGYFPK